MHIFPFIIQTKTNQPFFSFPGSFPRIKLIRMKALGEKGHPLEDQGRWLLVAFNPFCGCVPCCLLMLVFPLTAPGMEFFYHFIIQSLLCRGAGSSEHPKMPGCIPSAGFFCFWAESCEG